MVREADTVVEIQKWLKNASDREGGRQKRRAEKQGTTDTEIMFLYDT